MIDIVIVTKYALGIYQPKIIANQNHFSQCKGMIDRSNSDNDNGF